VTHERTLSPADLFGGKAQVGTVSVQIRLYKKRFHTTVVHFFRDFMPLILLDLVHLQASHISLSLYTTGRRKR
jgi:hypothetical protein